MNGESVGGRKSGDVLKPEDYYKQFDENGDRHSPVREWSVDIPSRDWSVKSEDAGEKTSAISESENASPTAVSQEIDFLFHKIDKLEAKIGVLRGKLEPVLSPVESVIMEGKEGELKKEESHCLLATRMRTSADKIEESISVLSDINERLEL